MTFLTERYQQLKSLLSKRDLFTDLVVADYFIDKCVIFSKNNLQPDEYNLFTKVYEIISTYLPKPDLLIYLYNTPENLLKNIAKRGRPYEQEITAEYLANIQDNYLNYLKHRTHIPILIVESSKLDFVNQADDYARMKDLLSKNYSPGITRIIF
jgi:deoxyadenosine/deoxycytidine kinase